MDLSIVDFFLLFKMIWVYYKQYTNEFKFKLHIQSHSDVCVRTTKMTIQTSNGQTRNHFRIAPPKTEPTYKFDVLTNSHTHSHTHIKNALTVQPTFNICRMV